MKLKFKITNLSLGPKNDDDVVSSDLKIIFYYITAYKNQMV